MRRFVVILFILFGLATHLSPSAHAQQTVKRCGVNFDLGNPNGFPKNWNSTKGMGWARLVYKETLGFGAYDSILSQLKLSNVRVLMILNHESHWGGGPSSWSTSGYANEFGSKAGEIAKHFGSKVDAYEIWNEPDGVGEAFAHLDPGPLAAVANAATGPIKSANPSAQVVIGGLLGGEGDVVRYINALKSQGALAKADGVSAHPYGKVANTGAFENYLNTIVGALSGKAFWITEFSWEGTELAGSPDKYIKDFYEFLDTKYTTSVPVAILYAWSDSMQAERGKFGLVDASGNPKQPVYTTFYEEGCSASAPLDESLGGIYIYPGIDDQPLGEKQLEMASRYMMTCGAKFTYAGVIENENQINTPSPGFIPYPVNCAGGGCVIPDVDGTLSINNEKTTIPLYRFDKAVIPNVSSESRRLDDFEGLFSARYTQASDSFQGFLANGGDSKTLSVSAKCENTLAFLESVKTLCENQPKAYNQINFVPGGEPPTLPSPTPSTVTSCPLNLTVPTPNGPKSYLDILASKPSGFSCAKGKTNEQASGFMSSLDSVETTTPKAFKPAYIVRYTNYPKCNPGDTGCTPENILGKFQTWFSPNGGDDAISTQIRVRITKIFVPANVATSTKDQPSIPGVTNSNFTSGLMNTILSSTSFGTQTRIAQERERTIGKTLQDSKAGRMINPSPESVTRYINCWECDQQSFVSTIVKRINAEIEAKVQSGSDDYNFDCNEGELAGEKAQERKSLVNPPGNPDPVNEPQITVHARLEAQNGNKGDAVFTRTFLLLPEEYRNVSEYENILAHTLLAPDYAINLFGEKSGTLPGPQKPGTKAFKFLQLSDTAPKLADGGLTVHMSSPKRTGALIGQTTDTPPKQISLTGVIVGTGNETFDSNPLMPGGRLARGLWEIMCNAVQPFNPGKTTVPYTGFEKLLQRGTSACFEDKKPGPVCKPSESGAVLTSSGTGKGKNYTLTVPAKAENFITSLPSEHGKKTCDWAAGKGLSFAVNANFGYNSTTPIGPFGFDGNINDAPRRNNDTMSMVIEKNGEVHVYDWNGRSGKNIDKKGKPDLNNVSFIVTGVYYDNFLPPYDGLMYRTAIGVKDNKFYIRTLAARPEGMRAAMEELGIDDGHFVMLDGDSVTQLCQANPDGTMTQIYPDPTDPDVIKADYPRAISVSMGIKSAGTDINCPTSPEAPGDGLGQTVACPGPRDIPPAPSSLSCANAPEAPAEWQPLKEGVRHLVNRIVSINDPRSSGNLIDRCFNAVVAQSLAAGINPIYTLTIWGQESGASNHERFPGVEDFGIHSPSSPVVGFQPQLNRFLELAYRYPNGNFASCFENGCTTENFSQMFKYGGFDDSCTIKATPYATKTINNMKVVAPNCDLPAYPTQMTSCH